MDITQGQPSGSRPNLQQRRIDSAYGQPPAEPLKLSSAQSDATVNRASAARGDSVELSGRGWLERARTLVAAAVNSPVTFDTPPPVSPEPTSIAHLAANSNVTLPMYRNPAIKNAVATELAIGKILDAQA